MTYSCPRCKAELTGDRITEPLADFNALSCPQCRGRLLNEVQLKMIEETVEPRLLEVRRIPSPSEQHAILHCPICPEGQAMEKYEHHRDRRVIVDHCPECQAIWLDGGELRAIREESLPVFLANTVRYFIDILK